MGRREKGEGGKKGGKERKGEAEEWEEYEMEEGGSALKHGCHAHWGGVIPNCSSLKPGNQTLMVAFT